ncbi:ubiquitin-conjugating enzyme family protein [Methanosarcina mazei]|uniref:Uncharacterized protein n=1 Tax=Methanosarcina mazei S-6 TaxID=213585 RepID=A0A0E3RCW1_METMZ|nr:hypothetical protein [Methanosarcina mazei]AKB63740.1 hypothetical protein MSMAS_0544 [Methanosarcina mazei S-6]
MEIEEVEKIKKEELWLCGDKWDIEGSVLVLFADLLIHSHIYKVKLAYPPLFPDTPIMVTPVEKDVRWSSHQYLSGTLCLEWGPDNWRSDVTAADMLNSMYKLIETENPHGNDNEHQAVPSRHFLTDGQVNRGKYLRLVLDNEVVNLIRSLPISEIIPFTAVYSPGNDSWTFHITKIILSDSTWTNGKIPLKLQDKDLFSYQYGIICHINVNKDQFSKITLFEEIEAIIQKEVGANIVLNEVKDPETRNMQKIDLLTFLTQENDIVCLWRANDKVYSVSIIEDNDHTNRNPSVSTI